MEKLFLYGASGHAKVVIDILEKSQGARILGLVDDNPDLLNTRLMGYSVVCTGENLESFFKAGENFIVSVGNSSLRRSIAQSLSGRGYFPLTAVHPEACIGRNVTLSLGTVAMAGVIVNTDTIIGCHCILNTASSVDHDCRIGNYSHIAPGATICGGVAIGEGCFIGAGAVILPGITIGTRSTVGAGATVTRNLPSGVTAVGTPARIIKRIDQQ